jgi:hypothetical protein
LIATKNQEILLNEERMEVNQILAKDMFAATTGDPANDK